MLSLSTVHDVALAALASSQLNTTLERLSVVHRALTLTYPPTSLDHVSHVMWCTLARAWQVRACVPD